MAELDCNCPHCGKMIGVEAVTKIMAESRMSFTMNPEPGSFMSTKAVGGSIEQIGKMLDACGRELGVKSKTMVEHITCADGAITVHLLITRADKTVQTKSQKRD